MNDYHYIRVARTGYKKLTPTQTVQIHIEHRRWLEGRLSEEFDGDAPPFERHWLDRLLVAAGVTDHVAIEDFDAITLGAFSSHAFDHLYEHLDRRKAPHRAGPDSARCATAWVAGLRSKEE